MATAVRALRRDDHGGMVRALGLAASLYCVAAGLSLAVDWQDPFAAADPERLARASAPHGGRGGLVVFAIRFWPYVLIGLGGYFGYNNFAMLRFMPKDGGRSYE